MTATRPVLSSLTSRLAQARHLAQGWLSQRRTERPEAIERLLGQASDGIPLAGRPDPCCASWPAAAPAAAAALAATTA